MRTKQSTKTKHPVNHRQAEPKLSESIRRKLECEAREQVLKEIDSEIVDFFLESYDAAKRQSFFKRFICAVITGTTQLSSRETAAEVEFITRLERFCESVDSLKFSNELLID